MNQPVIMAPPIVQALSATGGAYVKSLRIEIQADDGEKLAIDGFDFEDIMSVIGVRHLAFDPRTRAFKEGQIKASNLLSRINRNWSSIDIFGAIVSSIAGDLQVLAKGASTITWRQIN